MSDRSKILREKRALRERMKALRAGLSTVQKARAAEEITEHGFELLVRAPSPRQPFPIRPRPTITVSGFASLPAELRAWPLLRRLHGEGFKLALPVVEAKGLPLIFRAWAPGDAMDKGVWGIAEPKADKPVIEPDILLVPLLAFDRRGWRLGYGGGFYDRTLSRLRARKPIVAVGLAFDQQQVDAVPHLDYDQRLDWVLTPSGPIECSD